MGLAGLQNGMGVGILNKGRMAGGIMNGKGRTL